MRTEWRDYWKDFYKHARGSFIWSSLLTLLFFVVYLPILKPSEYWLSLKICVAYSASVFFYFCLFYGFAYAVLAHQRIKYKIARKLPTFLAFFLGISSSAIGVAQGTYFKARLLNKTPQYDEVLFSGLTGVFIALVFLFHGLYKDAKKKNEILTSANAESELHVFKNQMQPHFLFNSLNSLLSLIETNSKDAPIMTLQLASLYREILNVSETRVVTLATEISIVEKYLSLEKFRFGDRMEFAIDAPQDTASIFIPPLILQTLVENAVKHGISNNVDGGEIRIGISNNGTGYKATIANTGTLRFNTVNEGIGLKNSKARLGLIYGDKHNLTLEQAGENVLASFWFTGANFS